MGVFTLADVAWLEGKWSGEAIGGRVEEHWTAPDGNTMVGLFRLVSKDTFRVAEFLLMEQDEQGVGYHFRHFGAAMKEWEEAPMSFRLVSATSKEAVFESATNLKPRKLIYAHPEEDELVVTVVGTSKGIDESFQVPMRRANAVRTPNT